MPLQFAFHQLCELLDCNPSSAYIQKLNDVVLEHVASGGESLSGFIQWWDEHVETKNWSVELPAGNDAIRIMTIHASKGLEFPVVFIPFVDWGLMPKSGSLSWMEANSVPFASYGKLPVSIKKELAESHYATAFHNEILDTALDKLNMLYVAFTRAAVRLYAFASARPQANTCGKLLLETIASIPEWHQQLMANQGRSLEFGNDKPYIPKVGGEKEDPFYGPKPDPDQFSIPSKSGSEPTATPLRFKDKTEEMRIGDIIHHVLEQPDLTSTDPTRIDSILTYHADPLARGQRTHVRETILQTLNLLDQHGWNSSNYRVSAEQELCDTDSSIHRPDRVLFGKDQTIVIDFKTGNAEQSHKKQVSRYCKLIDSAGYGPAKGYLIYTSTLSVVPVE
jgi:ATP-dependent exoDNAse (exonuclease V) beta subunit